MPRTLSLANTLLSLRGRMAITDEAGGLAYEARGEFALWSPTWRIEAAGREVAQVRRRLLSWRPTWEVDGELGPFLIQRKLLSWTRQYRVLGGPADGAALKGSFFDYSFELAQHGRLLARAQGQVLTLRDRHTIEVLAGDERLVVIAMVVLQLDRREASSSQAGNVD